MLEVSHQQSRLDTDRVQCALEKISPQDFNDVVHVARWTRSLVTIVLNRDGEGDNAKALHFITKAHKVMVSDACLKAYPSDEGEWLLATAWQMGMTKFGWVATAWRNLTQQGVRRRSRPSVV